eukprot:5386762-Pleurochrysis_carterae.AAC.1
MGSPTWPMLKKRAPDARTSFQPRRGRVDLPPFVNPSICFSIDANGLHRAPTRRLARPRVAHRVGALRCQVELELTWPAHRSGERPRLRLRGGVEVGEVVADVRREQVARGGA